MLFDLQGKRRRVVQATYLMLAVLMGGGLVLFGIGGDVSGGLVDAFKGEGGTGGNSLVEDRAERAEERVRANPRDQAALRELARSNVQLANEQIEEGATAYPPDARDELRKAASAWERYLALEPRRPDDSLARQMVETYGQFALNQPAKAAQAAEIVAAADPSSAAFLQLAQYATQAGQTRKADLAAQRAIDLAPRDQRSNVRKQLEQIKALAAAQKGGAGSQGGGAPGAAQQP